MVRRFLFGLVPLITLFAGACGAGSSEVASHNIGFATVPSSTFTASQQARLDNAGRAIAALMGGASLRIELDMHSLPELAPNTSALRGEALAETFVQSVERLPHDLGELSPATRAHAARLIDRIVLYPANAGAYRGALATRERTLSASIDGSVAAPIEEEYNAYLLAHFRGVEVERVPSTPPNEQRDYFEYLKRQNDQREGVPNGTAVRSAITLLDRARASDGALVKETGDWLVARVTLYRTGYLYGGTTLALPAWRAGEHAWIAWMNGVIPSLSNEQLREVARTVSGTVDQLGATTSTSAFEGIDVVALASLAIERRALEPNEGRDTCAQARRYSAARHVTSTRLEAACLAFGR